LNDDEFRAIKCDRLCHAWDKQGDRHYDKTCLKPAFWEYSYSIPVLPFLTAKGYCCKAHGKWLMRHRWVDLVLTEMEDA
jgi:hypothetical protein